MDEETSWKIVQDKKKRALSSPETSTKQPTKQTKLDGYWLSNPVPTANSFSLLSNEDESPTSPTPRDKSSKPPPIFVDGVSNIQPLIALLDEHVNDSYEIKVLRNEQVKIQPISSAAYSVIVKQLEIKQTEFYTYKLKEDRSFKVILKNMHPSTDTNEIKRELSDLGHCVTNIWNIKQRVSKKPLPIFIVDLKQNSNNKLIYDIKSLMHCRIFFEPPRPKREPPQCAKCQQYGHTKTYCRRSPKCIKCAGNHISADCTRKNRSDDVKCALCEGNHPANYKGCRVFKELQMARFPPSRKKVPNAKETLNARPTITNTTTVAQSKPTYAQAVQADVNQSTYSHTNATDRKEKSDMVMMMDMLKQITQQLTTMTNLLLNFMTKLPNSIP